MILRFRSPSMNGSLTDAEKGTNPPFPLHGGHRDRRVSCYWGADWWAVGQFEICHSEFVLSQSKGVARNLYSICLMGLNDQDISEILHSALRQAQAGLSMTSASNPGLLPQTDSLPIAGAPNYALTSRMPRSNITSLPSSCRPPEASRPRRLIRRLIAVGYLLILAHSPGLDSEPSSFVLK